MIDLYKKALCCEYLFNNLDNETLCVGASPPVSRLGRHPGAAELLREEGPRVRREAELH